MAQIKTFLQKLSGQADAAKEAEREVQLLIDLANNKLDALEAKLRDEYQNKDAYGKIEIVGDRLGEFSRDYRVNFQDGDIGAGVQEIVAEIMDMGDESAKKLISRTITSALKAMFATTAAGAEEKRLFKVVFERVAVVRYDIFVWRYSVRSDGLFQQTKSVIAYTYARGVVDHSKVSVDELNDAIAQSMPGATIDEISAFKQKLNAIFEAQKTQAPDKIASLYNAALAQRQ